MMRGWLFIVAVLCAFAVLLCSIVPPATAYDSADSSRVTAFADSSGDWSGGISPDHDPDAPPREYDPGEAGFPSDVSEISQDVSEETTVDEDPGEAGLPSDVSESSQEASEETTVDDDPAEGGLPSGPVFLYFSDYVTSQTEDSAEGGLPSHAPESSQEASEEPTVDEDPGEAGLPSDAPESSQEASEEPTVDEDPGEAGLPSDASESSQEAPEEPATATDLKTLDDVYTVLVVLLGSVWSLAGLFFAFKLGGAFL